MTHRQFKGHFITLEGGEGAGKSTVMLRLNDYLVEKGYEVVRTREPGGSKLGELIRQWLLAPEFPAKIGTMAELLLFLAARAQHIEELIAPQLEAGKIVLCDRFNDSTIAYQGVARKLDPKMIQHLCDTICGHVQPELTLFLDVDPQVGLERSKRLDKEHAAAGQTDRIETESLAFHTRVREAFLNLAKHHPFRIYRIDANQPLDAVVAEAIRALEELVLLPARSAR